jgi:predicted small lipoprotein YifL
MKLWHKTWIVLLAVLLLAGCGQTGQQPEEPQQPETPQEEPQQPEDPLAEKILVVYFSATGHTGQVAEWISETLNADTFVITPKQPYTADDLNYNDPDSRVSKEHADTALQDAVELETVQPEDWDSYTTVLIGYPLWWGYAAWPVNQFVKGNDFTGKTVIPFCTSASSPIGDSGTALAAIAGTGDWQPGMRFASRAEESEVKDWALSILGK